MNNLDKELENIISAIEDITNKIRIKTDKENRENRESKKNKEQLYCKLDTNVDYLTRLLWPNLPDNYIFVSREQDPDFFQDDYIEMDDLYDEYQDNLQVSLGDWIII